MSVLDFKPRNARRCALICARHAARVQKKNTSTSFVSRDMRVPMQYDVHASWRALRWYMLQPQFQSCSLEVHDQRHFELLSQFPRTTITRGPIARSSSRIGSAQTSPRCQISSAPFAVSITFSGNRLWVSASTKMRCVSCFDPLRFGISRLTRSCWHRKPTRVCPADC